MIALLVVSLLQDELVKSFLDGKTDVEKKIRALGTTALPALAEARLHKRDAKAYDKLLPLYYEMKRATWEGDAAKALATKLETTKIDMQVAGAPLEAAIDFIAEFTGAAIVIDPGSDAGGGGNLALKDNSLRATLDRMTAPCGLDWDFRYGVVWIAKPERLWAARAEKPAAALTEAQKKSARAWVAKLDGDSVEEREQAAAELRKLGASAVPVLEEGARSKDAETAARCKSLIEELKPRQRAWAPLPLANAWSGAELKGTDKAVADALRAKKLSIDLQDASLEDAVALLRDAGEINVVLEGRTDAKLTIKAASLSLEHALQLITLPLGLDAKIADGAVVIVKPKTE